MPSELDPGEHCEEFQGALLRLSAGELDADAGERLRAHLTACGKCRASYDEMRRFEDGYRRILRSGAQDELPAESRAQLKRAFEAAYERWEGSRRRRRWVLWAAAAVLVLGAIIAVNIPGGAPRIELAMAEVMGTRGGEPGEPRIWRDGEEFQLKLSLSRPMYLHLVNIDALGAVEFYFPYQDAEKGQWDYWGYEDNFVSGGRLVLPRPGKADDRDRLALRIRASVREPSTEFFVAFANPRRMASENLLRLRDELRQLAATSGSDVARAASSIREALDQRFPGAALIPYSVAAKE
ncbi:MAG: DUF4384 domain-containing protein [Planctomycetes bacterium]|nr:DUF4384 domain-containing protein [Planctomycetota bacterium]